MKELDDVLKVQEDIAKIAVDSEKIESAIDDHLSIQHGDNDGSNIKALREKYEDMMADKALGYSVSDNDIEGVLQELIMTEKSEKEKAAISKQSKEEVERIVGGLRRKLEILRSEHAELKKTEKALFPALIRAQAETVGKEYADAVMVIDKLLRRLIGLSYFNDLKGNTSHKMTSPFGIEGLKIPLFNLDAHQGLKFTTLYIDNMNGQINGGFARFGYQHNNTGALKDEEVALLREAGVTL